MLWLQIINFFILKYLTDSTAVEGTRTTYDQGWWLLKLDGSSLLAHASNINDLLEGLDGVLEDWFDRLHNTKSSLHIVNLWLHSFDGLHLSGNFDEWLSVIESLEDSSGKSLLDVLNSGGLSNGGITITSGFGGESCLLYTSPSPRD